MQRIAFKMKLFKGCEAEYKKRHDKIWSDLVAALKETGIKDFSIFLVEETNILFAYLTMDDASKMESLPDNPVQKNGGHI